MVQASALRVAASTLAAACLLVVTSGVAPLAGSASAANTDPHGAIDTPAERASVSGIVSVTGWAIDTLAASGTGVDLVQIYLDRAYVGDAVYGLARQDVATRFRNPNLAHSGFVFSLNTRNLGSGTHLLEVRARSMLSGRVTPYTRTLTTSAPPAMPRPAAATPGSRRVSAPMPALAQSPPTSFNKEFGVNANLTWSGPDLAAADVDRARVAGLKSIRTDVQWDRLEPSAKSQLSADYLAYLDQVLSLITSRGMEPLLVVIGTPAWARGYAGSRLTPPANPQDYADTLGFLARRYAGQPGLALEVWNEPNQAAFWDTPTGPDASAYARLVKAAYPTIKAGDPDATVVVGSVAYNDTAFLQSLYASGGITGDYDALSIHPYSGPYAPDSPGDGYQAFQGAIEQTVRTMAQYDEQGRPIWITEMGWRSSDMDDATRALYLRGAVAIARSYPQIARFFAYTEDQADSADYGLITAAGNVTASWTAYSLEVAIPNSSTSHPIGVIDSPVDWANVYGSLDVSGWAIDLGSQTGPGIDGASVYLDGAAVSTAAYGAPRGDIGAAYGPRYTNSGFGYQLDLSRVAVGYHTLEVRAHSTISGGSSSFMRPLNVIPAPTHPVGALDLPTPNSSVVSAVHLGGWAADLAATGGVTGVDRVQVFLDGTYIQDAAYGTPRTDIGAAYGQQFANSGFACDLNLAGVGAGPHLISVRAHSLLTGADTTYTTGFNLLGSVPVGAFDSLSDLAVVSGTLTLAGWAIDGGAPDGTGITGVRLFVDGVYAGDASIGLRRPDIAAGIGAQFGNSGYSMVVWSGGIGNGWHVFDMRARSALTSADTSYAHPILVSN